jgi:hypothetical protein
MDHWLMRLADPVYGIVDLFLDSPFVALATTSALGALIAAAVLSLR